jgi:hypothetical protein
MAKALLVMLVALPLLAMAAGYMVELNRQDRPAVKCERVPQK